MKLTGLGRADPQTLSADAAQAAEGSTLVITSTDKSETAECRICKGGTEEGRRVKTSGKAESEAEVCKTHKTCSAGEWTEVEGTAKNLHV